MAEVKHELITLCSFNSMKVSYETHVRAFWLTASYLFLSASSPYSFISLSSYFSSHSIIYPPLLLFFPLSPLSLSSCLFPSSLSIYFPPVIYSLVFPSWMSDKISSWSSQWVEDSPAEWAGHPQVSSWWEGKMSWKPKHRARSNSAGLGQLSNTVCDRSRRSVALIERSHRSNPKPWKPKHMNWDEEQRLLAGVQSERRSSSAAFHGRGSSTGSSQSCRSSSLFFL